MTTSRPRASRLAMAAWATMLALAVAACGDDDADSSSAGESAPASNQSARSERPATDAGQIKALVVEVQRAFADSDGETICASLTPRGQKDIVTYGKGSGLAGDCVDVATALAKRTATDTKQPAVEFTRIRVTGDRAVADIRIADTTTLRQRYRKQDGEWKVGSFNLAQAAGL